jgi:hypothetical protein
VETIWGNYGKADRERGTFDAFTWTVEPTPPPMIGGAMPHSEEIDDAEEFDAEAEAERRYFDMLPGGDLHAEVRGWNDYPDDDPDDDY